MILDELISVWIIVPVIWTIDICLKDLQCVYKIPKLTCVVHPTDIFDTILDEVIQMEQIRNNQSSTPLTTSLSE